MKITIAMDSFKGTLSARESCECVADALPEGFCATLVPLSDGGEGICDILSAQSGFHYVKCPSADVYGTARTGRYLVSKNSAFIESALSCGITQTVPGRKSPLLTTTLGVGLEILDALEAGCKSIYVFVGGTAVNDLGTGMARALGYRFTDAYGNETCLSGDSVGATAFIDTRNAMPIPPNVHIYAPTDVTNPLCGENGASMVYSMQKGASYEEAVMLDGALRHMASLIKQTLKADVSKIPGAGAGGGLGGGLIAFCGACVTSGFDVISKFLSLEKAIIASDAVITGEGKTDAQTAFGKLPAHVAQLAARHGKACYIISGRVTKDVKARGMPGVSGFYEAAGDDVPDAKALSQSQMLLRKGAKRMFDDIAAKEKIRKTD